jgi:hypothetical protein
MRELLILEKTGDRSSALPTTYPVPGGSDSTEWPLTRFELPVCVNSVIRTLHELTPSAKSHLRFVRALSCHTKSFLRFFLFIYVLSIASRFAWFSSPAGPVAVPSPFPYYVLASLWGHRTHLSKWSCHKCQTRLRDPAFGSGFLDLERVITHVLLVFYKKGPVYRPWINNSS